MPTSCKRQESHWVCCVPRTSLVGFVDHQYRLAQHRVFSPLPMCPVPSNKQEDLERQRQEVGSIATSKMKDGLQSAYEYQPTPNAELEWVGQPTSTRGVVCRLPCEMEGSNYTNTISAAIGAKLIDHANITHPRKKYKRGGGTLPKMYFLRVSS